MDEWLAKNQQNITRTNAATGTFKMGTDWNLELTRLEKKRDQLHAYIEMKLEEHDYHAVQDAGSDLREIETRARAINEFLDKK